MSLFKDTRKDNDIMKVQAAQMQYPLNYSRNFNKQDTNFTGLHAPQKVVNRINKFHLLDHGYYDCADKFEVLVTQEPLFKGFLGKIVSFFSDSPIYIQAGEGIKKTAKGKLELTGVKTTKYLLGDEPKSFSAYEQLKNNIKRTLTSKKLTDYIMKDVFNVREFDPHKLKSFLTKKDFNSAMEHYAKQLQTKDFEGNTILHNNKDEVRRANYLLADSPNLLAKVHLVKNQYGNLPINNIHIMNLMSFDDEIILDTVKKLKDVPDELLKILSHRGSQGHSIIDILQLNANIENEAKIISTIEDVEGHLNILQSQRQ